ncbi:MAG TPA: hypothetical protein VHV78_07805, partial [Gemmatimonadaceae bacterium]|nr:hypothetical protein [Gemmatimonadaceae bacterium]
MSRRDAVKTGVGAGLALAFGRRGTALAEVERPQTGGLIERAIPSTGERMPVVGIGTAINYERASTPDAIAPLRDTLQK